MGWRETHVPLFVRGCWKETRASCVSFQAVSKVCAGYMIELRSLMRVVCCSHFDTISLGPYLLLFEERISSITQAMKRARASDVPRHIVRLNVGGKLFETTRETLRGSGFFASLLEFGGGDKDEAGNIFVDRNGDHVAVILECLRTSRRPPQRIISLHKRALLDECELYIADVVRARISGQTVDADLSPYCKLIASEEAEGSASMVNVFEAGLRKKDVAHLQLPPLLLSAKVRKDQVVVGDHHHCKDILNVQMGGVLLRLEQEPNISQHVIVAGGAVVGCLTGCSSGPPFCFVLSLPSSTFARLPQCAASVFAAIRFFCVLIRSFVKVTSIYSSWASPRARSTRFLQKSTRS